MTPEQFTYWLQGFFELGETKTLSERQIMVIKDHLSLVFEKVTPDRTENKTEEQKPDNKETPNITKVMIDTADKKEMEEAIKHIAREVGALKKNVENVKVRTYSGPPRIC